MFQAGTLIVDVSCDKDMDSTEHNPLLSKKELRLMRWIMMPYRPRYFSIFKSISTAKLLHLSSVIKSVKAWNEAATIRNTIHIENSHLKLKDIVSASE